MTILAGDIGGTKTLLQIAKNQGPKNVPVVLYEQRYVSAQFPEFDEMLRDFLVAAHQANVPMPEAACIGVAGPVLRDKGGNTIAKVTNLPWSLDANKLSVKFHLRQLRLINDFQAVGYGLEALSDDELVVVQAGEPDIQNFPPCALIGAGTGLGQGLLVWKGNADSGHYEVLGSEGGHADFAPGSTEQRGLLQFLVQQKQLAKQPERVCAEDVLSGRGLVNVYHYFTAQFPEQVNPLFTQAMLEGDAAAMVSEAALSGADPLAERALNLFIEIYGTQAGNLALIYMATGGVFIAGGIAPKIQSRISAGPFLAAFQDKGPMSAMMKKIPVRLVMNPQVGLKGAALIASRL
jgi:glucokinase